MPRKRRLSKTPRCREVIDLTLVEFLVNNEQKIVHSPAVEHVLDQATPLLRAGAGAGAEYLYRQAIQPEPDQVDLMDNLAASLQDCETEAAFAERI